MLKKIHLFLLAVTGLCCHLFGQGTSPVNGVHTTNDILYAFEGAKIYVNYDKIIESGTLLVRNGVVEEVGEGIGIPKDALVIPLNGKWIYPSFIDIFTEYGQPKIKNSTFIINSYPKSFSKTIDILSLNWSNKT